MGKCGTFSTERIFDIQPRRILSTERCLSTRTRLFRCCLSRASGLSSENRPYRSQHVLSAVRYNSQGFEQHLTSALNSEDSGRITAMSETWTQAYTPCFSVLFMQQTFPKFFLIRAHTRPK